MIRALSLLVCGMVASSISASDVIVSSGKFNTSTYTNLQKELSDLTSSLCFAHSESGLAAIIPDAATRCSRGVVIYGAVPTSTQLDQIKSPVLVVAGSRDGVSPLSQVPVSQLAFFASSLLRLVRLAWLLLL